MTEFVGGLPVVRVRGGARERGRAVGEARTDSWSMSHIVAATICSP